MTRAGSTLKLTYGDLAKLPEDDLRHELIDGEHYVTATPTLLHQRVVMRLVLSLGPFAVASGCGEMLAPSVDVVFTPHDVVVPDALFMTPEFVDRIRGDHLTAPPELMVEVLSPSTRGRDLRLKRRLYEQVGVREYWILDPIAATAQIFRQGSQGYGEGELLSAAGGDALTTALAPGWSLPLSALFR
jgi:Uma2 family endonuclease